MSGSSVTIAGLRTVVVTPRAEAHLAVVLLHGYAMVPEELAPFARSVGLPARFFVPEAPLAAQPTGRAWWDMDAEARARALATGPRDLYTEHPAGAPEARTRLLGLLEAVRAESGNLPVALVGFSQGGMLACDTLLRDRPSVAALGLLSSSRIAADEWEPLAGRLAGLPVLVSHGRADADLAFSAGEALRDLLAGGGARVTWVPFDTGHEIPLVVWRSLRKFLSLL
jgi:phospholipase/carboxylesterase